MIDLTEFEAAERRVVDDIQYRRSMARIGILIGVCFTILIALTVSFIATKVSQDQFDQVQQSQAKQGEVVEQKLCTTLEGLRSLKPPVGDPSSNPSRGYLQKQHDKLAQLSDDIGCKG